MANKSDFFTHFGAMPDPRMERTKKHKLIDNKGSSMTKTRSLVAFAVLCLVVAAAAVAYARRNAHPSPAEVRAQAFVLVDDEGQELARLAPTPDGSGWGLLVFDSTGKPAVGAATGETGSALGVFDNSGARRITLGVAPDGSSAGIIVARQDGHPAVNVGVSPQGAGIGVLDTKGVERAGLGLSPTGEGRLVARNQENAEVWHAP